MSFVWLRLFQLCKMSRSLSVCVLTPWFGLWLAERETLSGVHWLWQPVILRDCPPRVHGSRTMSIWHSPLHSYHIQPWFILLLTILLLHPHCFRGKNDKMMQLELMVKEQKKVIETQKDIIEDNKAVIEQFHKWRSILQFWLPWWCYTVYITPNCPYLVTDLDDW